MSGVPKSFPSIVKRLRRYPVETGLLAAAVATAVVSALIFFVSQAPRPDDDGLVPAVTLPSAVNQGGVKLVEVAGAVIKPGVYPISQSARLNDVIKLAQGLSDQADKPFFARNYNLARLVSDQEKIYVPSTAETDQGLFVEPAHAFDFASPVTPNTAAVGDQALIDINSATLDELDGLPGIGQVTGENIIKNRPYQNVSDLLDKKIVKSNVYEAIKTLITAN
ncbi:helix-hairpin-helix domain-containing protein [Patescibacteria group bacterium]|nr:helix-hairpin-helix domain-containing protein [Patescibacteria group bacterium]MCL5091565.1 helix-hairpin-helix domain-containing protein [Patescibacteria group bacterium]